MGLFDEIKKLAKPYGEDDDYDEDDYDEEDEPRPRSRSRRPQSAPVYDYEELGIRGGGAGVMSPQMVGDQRGKVLNIAPAPVSAPAPQQHQVVIVAPERFDSVTEIAESLRARNAVLLNLEGASQEVARRLVDFLSGCAFALDGKIKKVANRAYLITPFTMDIAGDLMDELNKSGMSFEPPPT